MALSGWEGVWLDPDEDEPRLVLADQLLGRGDPLGEYISLACRRAQKGSELEPEAAARLAELWRDHGAEFASRFGAEPGAVRFDRGFPSRLIAAADQWLETPELPAPIQRLELFEVQPALLPRVLSRPTLARLDGLTMRLHGTLDERLAGQLVHASAPKLRHLGLHFNDADSRALARLLASPLARQLVSLELSGPLGDEPAFALAPLSEEPRTLRRLTLSYGPPGWPQGSLGGEGGLRFLTPFGPLLHWAGAADERRPWTSVAVVGLRPGLRVTQMSREGGTAGLLFSAHAVSADDDSPRTWFPPPWPAHPALLEPLDEGDAFDGLWRLYPVPEGPRLHQLHQSRRELRPAEWAAAFAPLARWLAEHPSEPFDPGTVFLGPQGLRLLRSSPDLVPHGVPRFGLPTLEEVAEWPPELVMGQRRTRATDVYLLAARLAALLEVELARGEDPMDVMRSVLQWKVTVDRPDVPPPLARLLERCLARKPEERPELSELAEGLAAFRDAATAAAPTRLPPPSLSERLDALASLWLTARTVYERDPRT